MVMLWQDQRGAFSLLRAGTLFLIALPACWIAYRLAFGLMGSKPVNAAIHETGLYAVRLLLLTLLITPLKHITGSVRLVPLRRLFGLGALAYTIAHFLLYSVDERFDLAKVASEIVMRVYLSIGFVSFLAMAMLGATSTHAAIRRMGEDWNKLHRLIYPLTVLALLHAFLQSKINVDEAVIMSDLFIALMGFRLMRKGLGQGVASLTLLAIITLVITMGLEYLWYLLATGVPAERVFLANFEVDLAPRPALIAFGITLFLPLLALFVKFAQNGQPLAKRRASPQISSAK